MGGGVTSYANSSLSKEDYRSQEKSINSLSSLSGFDTRELTIGSEKIRIHSVPSSGGRTVVRAVGEDSGEFFRTVYTKSGSIGYASVGTKKEAISELKSILLERLRRYNG